MPGFAHAVTIRLSSDQERFRIEALLSAHEPLFEALQPTGDLAFLKQVHGSKTIVFPRGSRVKGVQEIGPADGIIIDEPGQFCVIRTADCVPVIAVAPGRKAAALFHAGWRGTAERVVEKGLSQFLAHTQTRPADIVVGLGPCLRKCCYEVGKDVIQAFRCSGQGKAVTNGHLDLVTANREQMRNLGITRILDAEICTSCSVDTFYSYRREKTEQRFWTLAGFRTA